MKMHKKVILFVVLFATSGFAQAWAQNMPSGQEIVQMMYERHHDSWYKYLTFKQETIFYKNGEQERTQWWYEALGVPGQLVIKFDSLDSGSGVIFRADSQYVFQQNKLVQQTPRVHDLLVLGFDVYGEAPEKTIAKLERRGFDLSKSYETEWQGRTVYVVGASDENENTNQFWIDKERLYFVRLLRTGQGGTIQETQFNNYEQVDGGWVAPVVLFYSDGQMTLKEIYSDIESHNQLSASIFDLENFRQATW